MRRLVALLCAVLIGLGPAAAQYRPGRPIGAKGGLLFANGFPASGAIVDYDFKNVRYSGPAITASNASGGYVDDTSGNWTLVPPNTLRRSNKGVLIEGAQTNSIRNSAALGGTSGSLATLPTNWSWVVGSTPAAYSLAYATENGMDVVEITIPAGNAGTYYLRPESNTAVAAANGQLWTLSSFLRRVSGNVSAQIIVSMRDTSGNNLGQAASVLTALTNTYQRQVTSITNNSASVTNQGSSIGITVDAAGGTLRVAWSQLEQWSTSVTTVGGASSPIRTTGTAATRAADVVSAPITGMVGSNGTLDLVYRSPTFARATGYLGGVRGANANNDRATFRTATGTPSSLVFETWSGTTVNAGLVVANAVPPDASRHAVSAGWSATEQAFGVDGATLATQNAPTSIAPTTLDIGSVAGGSQCFCYIERFAIYPYRAANSNLQTLSTLQNWGG
jgi:hypothetical protein